MRLLTKMHSITRDRFFPPPDMNIVFERSEGKYDNSELYQDILKYARKRRDQQGFKFSHVGRWLINENIEFRSYYTGSKAHVPKSARLCITRGKGFKGVLIIWSNGILYVSSVKLKRKKMNSIPNYSSQPWKEICFLIYLKLIRLLTVTVMLRLRLTGSCRISCEEDRFEYFELCI